MRHEPSGLDADVVFGSLPFERETVARVVWMDVGGVRVPLPRSEDLIILKAVVHRPQDLADIAAILVAQPRLNLRRVRRWVQEFSEALSIPEILRDLETYLPPRQLMERIKRYKGEAPGRVSHLPPPLSSAKKGGMQRCSSNWAN